DVVGSRRWIRLAGDGSWLPLKPAVGLAIVSPCRAVDAVVRSKRASRRLQGYQLDSCCHRGPLDPRRGSGGYWAWIVQGASAWSLQELRWTHAHHTTFRTCATAAELTFRSACW